MMNDNSVEGNPSAVLEDLEKKKGELIEEAKKVNNRLKYKEMELKAIEPFVKQTEDVNPEPVKRRLRRLEFKISTQAFTPKKEKELLKRLKTLEKEAEFVLKVERARKKKALIEKDLEELRKKKEELDKQLSEIREQIKEMRKRIKEEKKAKAVMPVSASEEAYFSLEDVVEIKRKNKKD